MSKPLLRLDRLSVGYTSGEETIRILNNVDLTVGQGEVVGIVGESGCGKSMTSLAIMGLLSSPLAIQSGTIEFNGVHMASMDSRQLNRIRGKEMAMIFQEPMTSLNPVFTVGYQIAEALVIHLRMGRREARERVLELLRQVGIPSPEQRFREYPHQLSGGMRQRVMIAMALACSPQLLIADEPTTALDVTIQAQILDLLIDIQSKTNMSLIFITHDLGVLWKMADRVIVMYGGQVIESAPMKALYEKPLHPYTQGLWKAIPAISAEGRRLYNIPGTVPDPKEKVAGCRFAPRCPHVMSRCKENAPPLIQVDGSRKTACFLYQSEVEGQ